MPPERTLERRPGEPETLDEAARAREQPPPAAHVLALQRSAGNQAVQQMLSAPAHTGPTLQRLRIGGFLGEVIDKAYARRSLEQLKSGTLISVKDWQRMQQALSPSDYRSAVEAFENFSGDAKAKDDFLKALKPDELSIFTHLIASRPAEEGDAETLEERVESSANPERAKQALTELTKLREKNATTRARLTLGLVDLLVWGVAEARDDSSDVGGEGIIGIEHAVDAAEALLAMPLPAYLDIVINLSLTGGKAKSKDYEQRRVESVLILKAVAARKAAFKKDAKKAGEQIGDFADEIRGEDTEALIESTSTRDIGGGDGLQQKFTMSCGPTSIQIVMGEADPVFALEVSDEAKHDLDYDSDVGKMQAKLLGKAAAPRALEPRWKAFKAYLNGTTIPAADLPKWQSMLKWLGGRGHTAAKRDEGIALAEAAGFTAEELRAFKKYFVGLETEPGLQVGEFQSAIAKSKLSAVTNAKYPLHQFAKGAVKDTDLEDIHKGLFRGRDILMGVIWNGGGGHYMVLTDVRGSTDDAVTAREFLLSDPWEGDSQWITGADLKAGKFGTTGSGYIDDIYY